MGGIKVKAYFISIAKIVNCVHQIGTGATLFIKNFILGLIVRNESLYVFDFRSNTVINSTQNADIYR